MDMAIFLKELNSVNSVLNKLITKDGKKCVLFDADGVLYDAERFSHWAAFNVLSLYNDDMPSKEELSNALVGIKVKDQKKEIRAFFKSKKLKAIFPKNFDSLRDERQKKLFDTLDLQPIDGVLEVLNYLEVNHIDYALVTRSRYEPMKDKLIKTGLNAFFNESNTFYPDKKDNELIEIIADQNNISSSLLDYDKTSDFLFAAAEMGYTPSQCVAIEDTHKGVNSIIYANITPICFIGAPTTNKESVISNLTGSPEKYLICNKMF